MDYKPDIIILTETWLNSDINNALLNITNYSIEHRVDRIDTAGGRGGGIIVYVKNGLNILVSDQTDNEFNQFCEFSFTTNDEVLNFVCFYRSPNSSPANNELLCELVNKDRRNTFIIGDLNYPNADWETGIGDNKSQPFLDAINNKFLTQCIDFPTHSKGNILDVIITDVPNKIINVEDIGRIGNSDHVMILCDILCDKTIPTSTQKVPDWRKADILSAKAHLSNINWEEQMRDMNTSKAWTYLITVIEEVHTRYIPEKLRRNPNKPPWLSRELIRKQRRKSRLWKKYKKSQSSEDLEGFKVCRKELQKSIRNAKRKLEVKLSKETRNPRAFNSYVKSKTTNRTTVGPLKAESGAVTSDPKEMTVILNKQFSSVFSHEDTNNMPAARQQTNNKLESVIFTPEKVKNKIDKLKPGSAPGPDNITVTFLRSFSSELCQPLSIIYNKSMSEGYVPEDWRKANVTPIFKKGKKCCAENYRPVSLTSIPCKMMESVIKDSVIAHLYREEIIKPSQHGFMNNKSVTTNLLEFLEVVTSALDKGESVDVLYLDFQKAFDKVPRERLLLQFKAHGITGEIYTWIRSWLTGRTQRVVLNGECSDWADVDSGVPQGSILGPVGFIVYINPLEDDITDLVTLIKKFADDTKCAKIIKSVQDHEHMQEAINNLCDWANKWSMSFNVGKCKIMHLGKNNPQYQYSMEGTTMKSTEEERDVGVTIHRSLKPSKQCAQAAAKANQVLGQISRAFHYRDRHIFVRLYKQYVRCHLEFAVSTWNPWSTADIELLEKVQVRAIRMVSGLQGTYEDKLRELNLQTLEERRRRADMIQTHKIIHGIDKVDRHTWFNFVSNTDRNTRARSDNLNLIKPNARLEIRRNFYSNRVIDSWNRLPFDVKRAASTNQFKNMYDNLVVVED